MVPLGTDRKQLARYPLDLLQPRLCATKPSDSNFILWKAGGHVTRDTITAKWIIKKAAEAGCAKSTAPYAAIMRARRWKSINVLLGYLEFTEHNFLELN